MYAVGCERGKLSANSSPLQRTLLVVRTAEEERKGGVPRLLLHRAGTAIDASQPANIPSRLVMSVEHRTGFRFSGRAEAEANPNRLAAIPHPIEGFHASKPEQS